MNDRFKFRVWYRNDKKMCEAEGVYGYTDESTMGGEVFVKGYKTSFYFPEEVELMQCTGLHDKNGKLIYEGDIVTGKDHFDRDRKCIVRYSETYCCYFIVGDRWSDEFMFNLYDKEVIGNIYENKELLEVE